MGEVIRVLGAVVFGSLAIALALFIPAAWQALNRDLDNLDFLFDTEELEQ